MAGSKNDGFRELISPFLRGKLNELSERYGSDSREYRAIARQYVRDADEENVDSWERRRHYEAEVHVIFDNHPVVGVERLYRHTILIEPTMVCAAHCRWCLRGQYPVSTLTEPEITHATRYIGSEALRDDINEVLITGGDPLMSLPLLALTLSELQRNAPNVRTVRIGSRVPFQDPRRINDDMLSLFARYPGLSFELGVNVNHPLEFWPESVSAIARLKEVGITVYNQHPLLRGVNDDLNTLVALYDKLRSNGIESHYIFHAIPLRGMKHHRTSLRRGLDLAAALSSCGAISGRSKPRFAVLSDIGKIVLYDGVFRKRRAEDNAVLLRSGFRYEERLRWVPGWKLPESAEVDEDGYLRVWYQDADEPI